MKEGETIKNVGRCPRCNKFLIEEELQNHDCDIASRGSEEITVDHFTELTKRDSEGHRLIVAQGLDGVQYWLIECQHNPPHATKRKFTPEGTKQGLDSTSFTALLRSWDTRKIRFWCCFSGHASSRQVAC